MISGLIINTFVFSSRNWFILFLLLEDGKALNYPKKVSINGSSYSISDWGDVRMNEYAGKNTWNVCLKFSDEKKLEELQKMFPNRVSVEIEQ